MGMSRHLEELRNELGHRLLLLPSVSALPFDEVSIVLNVANSLESCSAQVNWYSDKMMWSNVLLQPPADNGAPHYRRHRR